MYHSASLAHWFLHNKDKTFIPAMVDIDLTNICNQDCFYCNSADFRQAQPISQPYTAYIKLLEQLASWREVKPHSYGTLHTITYPGGGEPTLLKGYEYILEHTVDLGFLTSLTTNGTRLDLLAKNVPHEKLRKMAWIGVDIDSADPEGYEMIRRSKSKRSIFNKVISNTEELIATGANVDFKILLNDYNSDSESLEKIFHLSKKIGIRMIYFRPTILNNQVYVIDEGTSALITAYGKKLGIPTKINFDKQLPRNYNRCHQMFQFPVFAADGNVYTCCDNRGNPDFAIGSWIDEDFRDFWLSERHWEVYNKINTNFCKPCRPNKNNIGIQDILNDPALLETLYM